MQRFIMIRIGQALIAVVVVSIIVFSLSHLSGDPLTVLLPMGDVSPEDIDAIRAKWGLDKPIITQYGVFMSNALRGDFGNSYAFGGETAMGMVISRFPATLLLAGSALLVSVLIGIPLGVITAAKKDSFIDYQGTGLAFLGQAADYARARFHWLVVVIQHDHVIAHHEPRLIGIAAFRAHVITHGAGLRRAKAVDNQSTRQQLQNTILGCR